MLNAYRILRVSPDAAPSEIRAAYLALIKRYHPDLAPGDPGSADMAGEITRAFWMLCDPDRRARHDRDLSSGAPGDMQRPKIVPEPLPRRILAGRSRKPRLRLFGLALILLSVAASVAIVTANPRPRAQAASPAPAETSASDEGELRHQPPIEPWNIAGAVDDAGEIIRQNGIEGAEAYSRRCFAEVAADPNYHLLDHCTAFDAAAAVLAGQAPQHFVRQERLRRFAGPGLRLTASSARSDARWRAIERETLTAIRLR